jgi:hypothetical protein
MWSDRTDRADQEVFLITINHDFVTGLSRALLGSADDARGVRRRILETYAKARKAARAFHNPRVAGENLIAMRRVALRFVLVAREAHQDVMRTRHFMSAGGHA